MKYFMNKNNVDEYIKMCEGYDSSFINNKLMSYLEKGSSILELGMGKGDDFKELLEYYDVLESDNSSIFVDLYNKTHTKKAILLDAVNIDIDQKFDCIYSNKVLQHLTKSDFIKSIDRQAKALNKDGIIFMTLWNGEYKEEMMFDDQIRFTYYQIQDIKQIVKDKFDIVNIELYDEMDKNDSLIVVLKPKYK